MMFGLMVLSVLTGHIVCTPTLSGQVVTGTLTGTVTDFTGAAVPNAKVIATDISTRLERSTVTSSEGTYNLPYLAPGQYTVAISTAGFKAVKQENIVVSISTVARVDAALTPGSTSETITVTVAPPVLQTESAEVALNLDAKTVTDVPLSARNFQVLATLAAGVTPPSRATPSLEDPQRTTFFNANGQSNSANSTLVDGVDNTDPVLGLSIYLPAPELIQEVHVSTSNYGAEFGRVAGAVVNVTTRQGTNKFHGALWEYNRVAALAAKPWVATSAIKKPPLTRNDFGGTIGGPIRRDRTFFFGAYRGIRERTASTSIVTVPLPQFLSGDFSSVPGAAIYNPFTGNANGTGRQQFSNNVIPSTLISKPASIINKYFPAPNLPGIIQNYVANAPFPYNADHYTGRIDHSFSELTKISGIANFSIYKQQLLPAYGEPLGAGVGSDVNSDTAIVNFTHGFSATLLTELRVAYNLFATNTRDLNDTLTNAQAGISDPNPYPISQQGLAFMNIGLSSGPIGGAVTNPVKLRDNLFQVVDTWNKEFHNHSFKWGGEIHRNRMDRAQPQGLNGGPRGGFSFGPGTTQNNGTPASPLGTYGSYVNTFAAYLLGTPQQITRTYMTQTPTNRQTQIQAFFQDLYHVTPKLTLDLGVRYEYYSSIKPRGKGGASNFDPATNSLQVAGYGNIDLANGVSSQSMVEPRLGFAYSIDNNSVIRGGYAISGWTGRYGFTGGTLSTQFPVIYNVQVGTTGGYGFNGSINNLPAVPFISIPADGIITPAPNQAYFIIPRKNPMPYIEAYNLTYQRSMGKGFVTSVGYVGNVGRHTPANVELNAAAPGTGTAGLPFNGPFGRTASTQLRANIVSSNYNSLQANVTKNFSGDLSLTLGYAYSKSMDLGSNQGSFRNNLNLARQYGPSDFDSTHNLVISHLYQLPFGRGKRFVNQGGLGSFVLGGWQLNGVLRLMTGVPFTIVSDSTSCACPGNSQFADQIAPVQYLGGVGAGSPWFVKASFAPPAPNRFGTAARNSVRGASLQNYDFSLIRDFRIADLTTLQARGEFYNLTNTPYYNIPNSTVTDANFGIITGASGSRITQLALKLTF